MAKRIESEERAGRDRETSRLCAVPSSMKDRDLHLATGLGGRETSAETEKAGRDQWKEKEGPEARMKILYTGKRRKMKWRQGLDGLEEKKADNELPEGWVWTGRLNPRMIQWESLKVPNEVDERQRRILPLKFT